MNMKERDNFLKWIKRAALIVGTGVLCLAGTKMKTQAAENSSSALESSSSASLAGSNTINDSLSSDRDTVTYTLDFNTDGRLNVNIAVYSSYFHVVLYDWDGDRIENKYCDYNSNLGFGKNYYSWDLIKGTYYLEVYCNYCRDGEFYDYSLTWNYTSANSNEIEPNDNYAQAQKLGKKAVIYGQLAIYDEQDIYSINLAHQTTITLGLKSDKLEKCYITIYNEDGDREWYDTLYTNNLGSIDEKYNINLDSGLYYIYVSRSSAYIPYTGPYTLTYSSKMNLGAHNVSLSATSYTYNGKVKTPNLIVKDNFGRVLTKGVDYVVTGPNGRKKIGTYTYNITFTGDYKGTATKSFQIKPAKTKVTKLKKKSNGIRVTWKKSSNASGYMIYRRTSDGSYKKIKTIKSRKTCSYLDKGARYRWNRYYYKVVAYKKVAGKTYRSKASKVKSIYRR